MNFDKHKRLNTAFASKTFLFDLRQNKFWMMSY